MVSPTYTVADVMRAMDAWAPPALAYDWDRIGLHTGRADQRVASIVTCLSVLPEVAALAKSLPDPMIVAHHPLIWEPLRHLRTDDAHAALVLDLAAAGIPVYSAHTNLDVVPDGVNGVLAQQLDLHDVHPLFPAPQARMLKLISFAPESHLGAVRRALSNAGAGVIGAYTECSFYHPGTGTFRPGDSANPYSGKRGALSEDAEMRFEMIVPEARMVEALDALREAHPYEEVAYDLVPLQNANPNIGLGRVGQLRKPRRFDDFAALVCRNLDLTHARVVGDVHQEIRRVAVLGGSGGGEMARLPSGIDAYVTGDVKYHDALVATERHIALIDAGHSGTEKAVAPAIANYLEERFAGLAMHAHVEADVFRVVTGEA